MGDYYNKTRAPIGVTLRRGGSMSVGPKTWCYIHPEDEGTVGLAETLRKGFLVRALVPITPQVSATPEPMAAVTSVAPIIAPVPMTADIPAVSSIAPVSSSSDSETPSEAPSINEYKKHRKNRY